MNLRTNAWTRALARACSCLLLLATLLAQPAAAEKRLLRAQERDQAAPAGPVSAAALELQLRPYLEVLSGARRAGRGERLRRPTQGQLYAVASNWGSLSTAFRALYLRATDLPVGMSVYATPGGRFDVLYTTVGINRVDADDRYGYAAADWRQQSPGPNGVPDYIDEVAWACDSAWSMEVSRFAFVEPVGLVSATYPSSRYKVCVVNLDSAVVGGDTVITGSGYYGLNYVGDRIAGRATGYTSQFQIRNNWRGELWRDVGGNNYEARPQLAVRVTCCHEFFHAVQYAMTHGVDAAVYLDEFPVSWIEATAVTMEDLGHDSVNDYIQYCGDYFGNPRLGLLSPGDWGSAAYKNSVVALCLYEFCPGGPGISLVKRVFDNNYAAVTPFATNCEDAAAYLGTSWPRVIGDFHARSYFTGTRSRPGMFLHDARLLPHWSDTAERPPTPFSRAFSPDPWGLAMVGCRRRSGDDDTLTIGFTGWRTSGPVAADGRWALNLLLRSRGALQFDSVAPVDVDSLGCATATVAPWSGFDEVLVLVSNGHGSLGGRAVVAVDTAAPPPPVQFARVAVFPNPVSVRSAAGVTIGAPGLLDVSIYSMDGQLLWVGRATAPASAVSWDLTVHGAKRVGPGTCFAVIRYRQPVGTGPQLARRKLLLRP